MKNNQEIEKRFTNFANSHSAKFLLEYLEMLADDFADIRNYPNLTNETRKEVVKMIDELLIEKINIARGIEPKAGDNWK